MAVNPPDLRLFTWPRWAPVVFSTITMLAVSLTLVDVGISGLHLALAALIVALCWTACVFDPPGPWLIGKAVVLVLACAALASDPGSEVLFVACVVCAESAIELSTAASSSILGVAVVGVLLRAVTVGGAFRPIEYFPWPIALAASWMGGMFVHSQLRLNCELRSNQDLVASEAAAHERRRLAREIHDVIAHSMTVTTLHVSAARLALTDDPPDVAGALEALAEAEEQSRRSLADIRGTVGLLSVDAPEDSQMASPLPTGEDIAELVHTFAEAGQQVSCSIEGDLASVPTTTGLAVYRVVQESLANAAKHAPGAPVDVVVRVCPGGTLDVQVTNGAATGVPAAALPGGGRGLVGMNERVELLGGRIESGPLAGGWRVSAKLPVAQADVTPVA